MEWHNTTLLCYFMDFYTFTISPKFYNYGLIQNRGNLLVILVWDFVIAGEDKKDL